MKSILNLTLVLLVSMAFFACKEKVVESTASEVAANADGVKYTTNAEIAKIMWEGSKPKGKHQGDIKVSSGDLFVNNGAVTAGSFILDMNSINVTDLEGEDKANLEAHLKGTETKGADDFFNVTKFPTGKFEITSVEATTENDVNFIVKGNLTLKDITNEISIPANISVSESSIVIVSKQFTINRTEWGINYGSKNIFKELGDKFIDDNISLQIKMEAKAEVQSSTPAQ